MQSGSPSGPPHLPAIPFVSDEMIVTGWQTVVTSTNPSKRRVQHEERRLAHRRALADDLAAMATSWSEAERIRAFLDATTRALPVAEQSSEFSAWLAWAQAHAASLDPLSRGTTIGKSLEPEPLNSHDG